MLADPGSLSVSALLAQAPALIAGAMLLRGSLAAAAVVRWVPAFLIPVLLGFLLAGPPAGPIGLTLAYVRIHPAEAVLGASQYLLGIFSAIWLFRQLGSRAIEDARAAEGRQPRQALWAPIAMGTTVSLAGFLAFLPATQSEAGRAKAMAAEQLGPGYRYHLSEIRYIRSAEGSSSVAAIVTAWNSREIKRIPVHWKLLP